MTEEELHKLWLQADEEETEASSKYHHLLEKLAPARTGGEFISGDPSVLEDVLAAEKVRDQKRKAESDAAHALVEEMRRIQGV